MSARSLLKEKTSHPNLLFYYKQNLRISFGTMKLAENWYRLYVQILRTLAWIWIPVLANGGKVYLGIIESSRCHCPLPTLPLLVGQIIGNLKCLRSSEIRKDCVALEVFLLGKHEFITNFLPLPEFRIYFLKDFSSWELKHKGLAMSPH